MLSVTCILNTYCHPLLIKSKLFGATLIVAGTSIGASMLALPLVSSSLGIFSSTLLLLIIWWLGYYTSILALKINLFYNNAFSISELCKKTFKLKIWIVADLSIITLFYSLLAAYISGIVEISLVRDLFPSSIAPLIGRLIVLILVLFVIYNFKLLDLSNRIIFFVKAGIFLFLLILLMPQMKGTNIVNVDLIKDSNLCNAIPVFFTSFGFHGSIPFIMKYLDCDERQIKKAFLLGSLLGLIIYGLWIFSSVSVLPQYGDISFESVKNGQNNLGAFITALSTLTGNKSLSLVMTVFSWLAIITSFLGVGIGLYDYFLEKLQLDGKPWFNKIKVGIITFAPPVAITIINKDIFVKALAFAAISLSILAVVLPSLIALKINNVVNSKAIVILTLLMGIVVIASEIFSCS